MMRQTKERKLAARVAEIAGVSLMTVSRVFSGAASVRDETRQRVMNAAAELGYKPNVAARALRTGRSDTVGFVISSPWGLGGDFHSATFSAFESELSARGLSVFLSISSPDGRLADRVRQQILAHRCGVLVVRFDEIRPNELRELQMLGTPVVLANYLPETPEENLGLSTVGFNNGEGIVMAVRHLVALGHKRIGHLGGTPGWVDTIGRERGFRNAIAEASLPLEADWVRSCDFARAYDTGMEEMNSIFSQSIVLPTAVVCDSDEIAAGAMAAAKRWNRSLPRDFSVVGFDDTPWGAMLTPPLTSIGHSGLDLGRALGKLVLRLFNNPDAAPEIIAIRTKLVVRESTGPAPADS
jgi:DNA-binding LacI/PurR family transcriptional regulator